MMHDIHTLSDLAIERAKYGVARLTIDYSLEFLHPVHVTLWIDRYDSEALICRGSGDTEAEAIDDAFARLRHVLGAGLREQLKETD